MSDERWIEVDRDMEAAVRHFAGAVRLFADPDLRTEDWEGYKTRMGLMHAMQAGHTSLETALLRILDMLGEERPTGDYWHPDLIRRATTATGHRPAILPPDVARSADRTRRFRHVAVRTYDQFEPDEADGAIKAAAQLVETLVPAIARFKAQVDTSDD